VTVGVAVLISACGWPVDESAALPDGVAVAAFCDRSGESEAAQFHDLPVLLRGENLGPLAVYLPEAYLFTATPAAESGDAPVLAKQAWPGATC
jgi:hypothetical protein